MFHTYYDGAQGQGKGTDHDGLKNSVLKTYPNFLQINGYETDDTQIEDSDCEEPHQSYR